MRTRPRISCGNNARLLRNGGTRVTILRWMKRQDSFWTLLRLDGGASSAHSTDAHLRTVWIEARQKQHDKMLRCGKGGFSDPIPEPSRQDRTSNNQCWRIGTFRQSMYRSGIDLAVIDLDVTSDSTGTITAGVDTEPSASARRQTLSAPASAPPAAGARVRAFGSVTHAKFLSTGYLPDTLVYGRVLDYRSVVNIRKHVPPMVKLSVAQLSLNHGDSGACICTNPRSRLANPSIVGIHVAVIFFNHACWSLYHDAATIVNWCSVRLSSTSRTA